MKVLIACEYSGIVRDAFIARGHDAMSCDLLPTESPVPHYEGDVFDVLYDGWDMMIGHPVCTYLCNSGVSWLHKDASRWIKLFDGARFFKRLWQAPIKHICLENPIMHKYALELCSVKQTQVIQLWMFGHDESKATCLWLKNLKPLQATHSKTGCLFTQSAPKEIKQTLHYLPPSPDRAKLRSKTFPGIAAAMAAQWG